MEKEQSLREIARAMTRFQAEIADMLDAKATEAEKVRNWITLHMLPHETDHYGDRLKQAMGVHEMMIEVIDSLSKMQSSLGQHFKLLVEYNGADGSMDGFGGAGGLDDGGGIDVFGNVGDER